MSGRNIRGNAGKGAGAGGGGLRRKNASPIRVVVRCAWSGARLTVPTTTSTSTGDDSNDDGGAALPPIIASSTTLLDLILRLGSSLPPSLLLRDDDCDSITLVCLRKVVPRSQWESTTLGSILDGDDGSAGVVLTLDLGGAGGGGGGGGRGMGEAGGNMIGDGVDDGRLGGGAPVSMTMTRATAPIEGAISSAASSLNIKPAAAVIASSSWSPSSFAAAASSSSSSSSSNVDPNASALRSEPMDVALEDDTPSISTQAPEEAWDAILGSNFDVATKDCLGVLLKLIDNLLSSRPDEMPKFRSIRCANAAFDKKVGKIRGGYDFLYSVGFVPKYPAFAVVGVGTDPETLVLPIRNESREMLLRGRTALIVSAVRDLGMDANDLPPSPPECPPSSPPPTTAIPSSGTTPGSDRPRGPIPVSSSGFDIYRTHSYNVQSAVVGAPNPYTDGAMSTTERQLRDLQTKKERMEREMQSIAMSADRGLVAYHAGEVAPIASAINGGEGGVGGKSDSSLLAARMKRMEEDRKKREDGGFTTRAMRDLETMKKAKVYSHAQIRVNFSDGTHLHAKFLPSESVSSVRSVIKSAFRPSLAQSLEFDLYVAPPRRLLNDAKTLAEEDLVPAAKIHVSWRAAVSPAGGTPGCYLRDELFSGGNNIAMSAFPDAKPIVREREEKNAAKSRGIDGNVNDSVGAPSKEELLLQRMLGKGKGEKKSISNSDQGGAKMSGKPKWFK